MPNMKRTQYVIDLVYLDEDGAIYRQGFTLARTEHLMVAERIVKQTPISVAIKLHHDVAEFSRVRVPQSEQDSYKLRIREVITEETVTYRNLNIEGGE